MRNELIFASRRHFIHANSTVKMCHACTVSTSKCTKNCLAAGLHADPLARFRESEEEKKEGREEREGKGKREDENGGKGKGGRLERETIRPCCVTDMRFS